MSQTLRQEALLPGTHALPRGTVEVSHYDNSILVRTRQRDGMTTQRKFKTCQEAMVHFWVAAERLEREVREWRISTGLPKS